MARVCGQMKQKRKMQLIRLDADVRDMIDHARSKGQNITYLSNVALRIYLPKLGFSVRKAK